MSRALFWTLLIALSMATVYVIGCYAAAVLTAPLTVTP